MGLRAFTHESVSNGYAADVWRSSEQVKSRNGSYLVRSLPSQLHVVSCKDLLAVFPLEPEIFSEKRTTLILDALTLLDYHSLKLILCVALLFIPSNRNLKVFHIDPLLAFFKFQTRHTVMEDLPSNQILLTEGVQFVSVGQVYSFENQPYGYSH